VEPPAQYRTCGIRWRCRDRSRGLEVWGVDARERSQTRGSVVNRPGTGRLRARSPTHLLPVAPRHEEPVQGVLDRSEVRAALLTGHGPLATSARTGVTHRRVEDHPPPEAEVMWCRCPRAAGFLDHRPNPPHRVCIVGSPRRGATRAISPEMVTFLRILYGFPAAPPATDRMVRSKAGRFLWVPGPEAQPRAGLWSLPGGPRWEHDGGERHGRMREVRRLVRRALTGRFSGSGQRAAFGRPDESDPRTHRRPSAGPASATRPSREDHGV